MGSMNLSVPVHEGPVAAWQDRLIATVVVAVAVFFVALLLQVPPDPRGHGTHEALGMTPCSWPIAYGMPCPACGVTTAATHLVQLQPIAAVTTQPFGVGFALTGLWAAAVAGYCLLRGKSFLAWVSLLPLARILIVGFVLWLGSWAYVYVTWPTV